MMIEQRLLWAGIAAVVWFVSMMIWAGVDTWKIERARRRRERRKGRR